MVVTVACSSVLAPWGPGWLLGVLRLYWLLLSSG